MALTPDNAKRVLNAFVERDDKFEYPGVVRLGLETYPWEINGTVITFTYDYPLKHVIKQEYVREWYITMRRNHLFRDYLELLYNRASGIEFKTEPERIPYADLKDFDWEKESYSPPWGGIGNARYDDWLTFHLFFSGLNQNYAQRQVHWERYHPIYTFDQVHDVDLMKDVVQLMMSNDLGNVRPNKVYGQDTKFSIAILPSPFVDNLQAWKTVLETSTFTGRVSFDALRKSFAKFGNNARSLLYVNVSSEIYCYSCSVVDIVAFFLVHQVQNREVFENELLFMQSAKAVLSLQNTTNTYDATTSLYPITEFSGKPLFWNGAKAVIHVSLSHSKTLQWLFEPQSDPGERWAQEMINQWMLTVENKTELTLQVTDRKASIIKTFTVKNPEDLRLGEPVAEFVIGNTLAELRFIRTRANPTDILFADGSVSPGVAFDAKEDSFIVETPESFRLQLGRNSKRYAKERGADRSRVVLDGSLTIPWRTLVPFEGNLLTWKPRGFECVHYQTDGLVPVVAYAMRPGPGSGDNRHTRWPNNRLDVLFRLVTDALGRNPIVLFVKSGRLYMIANNKVELLSRKLIGKNIDEAARAEYLSQAVLRLTSIYGKPSRMRAEAHNFIFIDYYEKGVAFERAPIGKYILEKDYLNTLFTLFTDDSLGNRVAEYFNHDVDDDESKGRCVGRRVLRTTNSFDKTGILSKRATEILEKIKKVEQRKMSETAAKLYKKVKGLEGTCTYCNI